MPPKPTAQYTCLECGATYIRWQGQCDQCAAWNALEPVRIRAASTGHGIGAPVTSLQAVQEPKTVTRLTGSAELDRVLGGGWVDGSVNLVCGEPGIGKSTLVLQSALDCAKRGHKTLYITAEESAIQVKKRAGRLVKTIPDNVFIVATTDMDDIVTTIENEAPELVILDSIQMVTTQKVTAMPGALNQVRLCAAMFITTIKLLNAVGIMVGHITKDGQLAGPKMLEHMVDVIVFFEGDRSMGLRVMRSLKNRYGTTNETGMFRMTADGLTGLGPNDTFLSDLNKPPLPGAIITAILSGTRGMLIELQSLVAPSGYQPVKRTFMGLDSHRCHVMIAIMDKFFGLKLTSKDIFLSLIGGIKSPLPDVDLAICYAILSSHTSRALSKDVVVLGEVGLTGEILPFSNLDRYRSAMTFSGIKTAILPQQCQDEWPKNSDIIPRFVATIKDAYTVFIAIANPPTEGPR